MKDKSPKELLRIANEALEALRENAALFGRGNEIDIQKAANLILLVTDSVKFEETMQGG